MTLLYQLRRAGLKVGLDVKRASTSAPARLVRLLRERNVDCVLDVGANHGHYGDQLRQFGYQGPICSFEPLPDVYEVLAQQARRDPNWTTYNFALGADDGVISLNVAGNEGGASSSVLRMLPRHEVAAPEARYVRSIDVPIHRLNSVWGEVVPSGSTTFLKLDVQGFEGPVLDGAADHLGGVVGVQLEISLVPLYEGALTLRDVLDRMDSLGMRLVYVEPGFSDPRTGDLLQFDGVFCRSQELE